MTVVKNERYELISTLTVTSPHMCTDYRKVNDTIQKNHFPLPFLVQMLEQLVGHSFFSYWTDIQDFSKFPSIKATERKPFLLAPMKLLIIVECHLSCAMPQEPFKGACLPSFAIMLST